MKTLQLLLMLAIAGVSYSQDIIYTLSDFYSTDEELLAKVDTIFNNLSDVQRVGQMIVPAGGENGRSTEKLVRLVAEGKVGSVNYLKGTKEGHRLLIQRLNEAAALNGQLPILHAMDAEPSLMKLRMRGGRYFPNTYDIKSTSANDSVTWEINKELLDLGILHNYAPVSDLGTNNAAIRKRSYGLDLGHVINMNLSFMATSHNAGIVATAKHFPGHGFVKGDTHKQAVYISGELKELPVYPPLIENGLISILVGHMSIRDNERWGTNGLPASLSRNIVTDLLKTEMGFKGLVVTDALNGMDAVSNYKNSALMASKAGNDLLCMPLDEDYAVSSILAEMEKDEEYRQQVHESVKKIIRLKIVLGLL